MTIKGLGSIKNRDEWMTLVKQAAERHTGTMWREEGSYIIEPEHDYIIGVYDYTDDYAEAFIYGYLDEYVGSLIEEEKQQLKED